MADLTAQILVNGSYLLLLFENDRPHWNCIHLRYKEPRPTITWIPSKSENILKDGLLMIAIHCLADEEIIKRAKSMSKEIMNDFVTLSLTDEQLAELYAMNRKDSDTATRTARIPAPGEGHQVVHLVITTLAGGSSIGAIHGGASSIEGQLEELKLHRFDVEIAHSKWYEDRD